MADSTNSTSTSSTEPAPGSPGTGRNRKDYVSVCELSAETLVGSWFHALEEDVIVWQGIVVAEPQPGVYLLHVDTLEPGARNVQRLVGLEKMVDDEDNASDWRFFDTEEQARNAYAEWLITEKERA